MPTKRKSQEARSANERRADEIPSRQRGLGAYAPDLANAEAIVSLAKVPINLIDVPGDLERLALDDAKVEELASSIREDGLHYGVLLRPRGPKFELLDGRHRLEAHRRLGLEEIAAELRGDLDDGDALVARAVVNLQRRKVSPYEEALAFRDVLETGGLSQESAAARFGVSVGTLRNRLRILALPEDLARRVGDPDFTAAHADVLLELGDPQLVEAAREVLAKRDWEGQPLDAREFRRHVRNHLEQKNLLCGLDWKYDEVANHKAVKEAVAAAPKFGEEAVVDVDGKVREAIAAARRKRHEKQVAARGALVTTGEADEEDEEEQERQKEREAQREAYAVRDLTETKARDLLYRAAGKFAALEKRLVLGAAVYVANGLFDAHLADDELGRIAVATGIPVKDLEEAMLSRDATAALVERLAKKRDEKPLARFLASAIVATIESYEPDVPETLLKSWTQTSKKDLEKLAKKELAAGKRKPRDAGDEDQDGEP